MTDDHEESTCLPLSLALQRAMANGGYQLQIERHRLSDALDLLQQRAGAPKTPASDPAVDRQRLGDRLGVAARDQPEKQELEDFIIGKRRIAMFPEAIAQPSRWP